MTIGFRQYVKEDKGEVYFTFGRMNPPTVGHGKVMDKLAKLAGKNPYKVFVSQTQDAKKNPLSYSDKVKHVRKMFPKHARSVMINKKVKTAFDAITSLYDEGHINICMVVGSDRVREFDILINKYNGVKARHGFYNFKSIKVISAGERDPDAEGVGGMSASKQRSNASENDFNTFSQGVPTAMSNKDTRKLFNDVRKGMGLKEEKSFKNHLELGKLSDTREQYIKGNLFELGDSVRIKEDGSLGTVGWLGTNYLLVDLEEGRRVRKWIDAVQHVTEASMPSKAGPQDAVDVAKDKIKAEVAVDREKHKKILARARIARAHSKNRTSMSGDK
jgi:hypothetical protein